MEYLEGLRKLFTGHSQPLRTRQLEAQEQAIMAPPQLREAPVQAPMQPSGAGPEYDAAEAERAERERLLQEALQRLRGGG